jgi:hypothetical protein
MDPASIRLFQEKNSTKPLCYRSIYMYQDEIVISGIGLGMALAIAISWSANKSIFWSVVDAFFRDFM